MNKKEYYQSGELKSEGELLEIIDCTSRGSGRIIQFDDHGFCVECILEPEYRKTGQWKYFYKSGRVSMIGSYVVLDYIGVPSKQNGLWSFYYENGNLLHQIIFDKGEIIEYSSFSEDGSLIE